MQLADLCGLRIYMKGAARESLTREVGSWPARADSVDHLGMTAVQIARTSRHIEHGGAAHNDAELQIPDAARAPVAAGAESR
jgi:hypothetical protein